MLTDVSAITLQSVLTTCHIMWKRGLGWYNFHIYNFISKV